MQVLSQLEMVLESLSVVETLMSLEPNVEGSKLDHSITGVPQGIQKNVRLIVWEDRFVNAGEIGIGKQTSSEFC